MRTRVRKMSFCGNRVQITKNMNEKLIERKLRTAVKKLGGLALKFVSPGFNGVPDRIVLMPTGRLWFVELKTTKENLKPIQRVVIKILRKLGFGVYVIDTQEDLDNFLNMITDDL